MKLVVSLIGLLTILGGVLPFLSEMGLLPESLGWLPTSGPGYQLLIIGIGVIAFIYGLRAGRRVQKWVR